MGKGAPTSHRKGIEAQGSLRMGANRAGTNTPFALTGWLAHALSDSTVGCPAPDCAFDTQNSVDF